MVDNVLRLKDGRNLGYAEYGVSSGVPVLFFHGTPGARLNPVCTMMDSIAKKISGPSIRLIAIDRPGYGLSDPKPARTMQDSISDVIELVDYLNIDRFSIIAISGGAPYALSSSAKLEERINKVAIVCGLGPVYIPEVLENLSLEEKGTIQAALFAPEHLAAFTQQAQSNPAAFVEKVLQAMSETERKAVSPELVDGYIQLIAEGTKNSEGMISDYKIFAKDWGLNLEEITVPFHFWHSDNDENVPIFHAEFLTKVLPNSELTRLKGFNHYTASLAMANDVIDYILKEN